MLELSQSLPEEDVTIESKEVRLNFDSRVARGLVVTVRALDQPIEHKDEHRKRVSFSVESLSELPLPIFEDIAKAEILSLERKKAKFPDSDILLNHLASLYSLIGDHHAAVSLLREGLRESHSDVLKYRLATTLVETGDLNEADQLLEGQPGEWKLPSLIGRTYICVRRNDIASAKTHVTRALEVDYFDYSARLIAGAIHIWEGAYADAIRSFKVASEERPKSSIPLVHMGAAYFAIGQRKKALSMLRRATNLNPLDDKAVSFYCDLLFSTGRPELAVDPLERIYSVWGGQTKGEVLDRLAKAYLDSAQHKKALLVVRGRLLKAPDNVSLLNNAGIILWKGGVAKEAKNLLISAAEKILLSAEHLTSQAAIPITNLLHFLLRAEEYSLATNYGKRLLDRLARDSDIELRTNALVQFVEGLSGMGKGAEAANIAEDALARLDVTQPSMFKLVSFLLHYYSVVSPNRDRVRTLAKEAFMAAKRADVDEKLRLQCANNAVFALLQFNEMRQAAPQLGLIASHALKNPYVTATFGLYYLRKNDIGKGRTLYDRAVQLTTDRRLKSRIRQRMALELAKQYASHNEDKEALYWIERAIRERPGFDFVRSEALELRGTLVQKELH